MLEATIGFNKRDESDESEEVERVVEQPGEPAPRVENQGRIKLTIQDQKFLRALKISIDEDHPKP